MPLPPELKELLACPKCKGDLEFREAEGRILCRACKLAYRIEKSDEEGLPDIPVMLIDEATPIDETRKA
jgi:uncharacterized protein YbaR (Trm112 family)